MRRGVSGAGAALVCLRAAVWGALTCAFSSTSPIASKDWASAMSLPSRSIPRSTLTANGPSPGGGSSASPPSPSIARQRRYASTCLLASVLPAPLSPLTTTDCASVPLSLSALKMRSVSAQMCGSW